MLHVGSPYDRCCNLLFREQPSDCNLHGSYSLLCREFHDTLHDFVAAAFSYVSVVSKRSWSNPTVVFFGGSQFTIGIIFSGKEPARGRAPRNHRNLFLAAKRKDFPFLLSIKQVVQILHARKSLKAI